jgi:hypothetical protein
VSVGDAVEMTTPSELAEISAAIHDEWFDVGSLKHDADRGELQLPIYFGQWTKRWIGWSSEPPADPLPPPDGTLVIRNVIEFLVEDAADVGWYNVSHLAQDADSGELRVVSNIPCEIVVRSHELDVEFLRQ